MSTLFQPPGFVKYILDHSDSSDPSGITSFKSFMLTSRTSEEISCFCLLVSSWPLISNQTKGFPFLKSNLK